MDTHTSTTNKKEERRMRALTDEDIDAICHRLTEFSGLTPEEHREHHQALTTFIAWHEEKIEFRKKVTQQVGGWLVISILAVVGTAVWKMVVYTITKGN